LNDITPAMASAAMIGQLSQARSFESVHVANNVMQPSAGR
jgi:hypothetical protein